MAAAANFYRQFEDVVQSAYAQGRRRQHELIRLRLEQDQLAAEAVAIGQRVQGRIEEIDDNNTLPQSAPVDAAALAAALAVQKPNSRAAESEADRIGIELAARAGYDPRAAITLWQKMAKVGGKGPPEFLSTHPSPQNREKKLAELVPQMMPYYEQKGDRPIYRL